MMELGVLALCCSKSVLLLLELCLLWASLRLWQKNENKRPLLAVQSVVLVGEAWAEAVWIWRLLFKMAHGSVDSLSAKVLFGCARFSWFSTTISYVALAFFLEQLVQKDFRYGKRHYLVVLGAILGGIAAAYTVVAHFHLPNRELDGWVFYLIDKFIIATLVSSIFAVYWHVRQHVIPIILKQQVVTLITYLVVPHVILSYILATSIVQEQLYTFAMNFHFVLMLNDFLYIAMLYFCARKILRMRFLNVAKHVQAARKYNFVDDFKAVLLRLSKVVKIEELQHVTAAFFAQAFKIHDHFVALHIKRRSLGGDTDGVANMDLASCSTAERIFFGDSPEARELSAYLVQARILVRDEIEFDCFYEDGVQKRKLLELLDSLHADIFLPIYERSVLVGYVIVQQNARPSALYGNVEQDEMCVFAAYLGAIINLLQSRDLVALVKHEKELKDELFHKQHEINHYKESIKHLLAEGGKSMGIGLVKGRAIIWLNDHVREMLNVDPLVTKGQAYHLQCLQLAREAQEYRAKRRMNLTAANGALLTCTATPFRSGSGAVLTLGYQEATERFMIPFQALKDITKWEYSLYLETTKSGSLIHQLVPGTSEALVNFKIDLLKMTFSKKPALLEIPEDDLPAIVQLIHTISLRDKLVVFDPSHQEIGREFATELFGLEPLMTADAPRRGLLEQLGSGGTLHIHHIERLSLDTQARLVDFLQTSLYQPVGSTRSLRSAVRIVCSAGGVSLQQLVDEKRFSYDLFTVLRQHAVSFASLMTLSRPELQQLVHQITQAVVPSKELQALVHITEREAQAILSRAPSSFAALKQQVVQVVLKKRHQKNMEHLLQVDTVPNMLPGELKDVVRQGKYALKNKRSLQLLWNAFKSQAKIATILNVNRSSISRRLREFEIDVDV